MVDSALSPQEQAVHTALLAFANAVRAKFSTGTPAWPEDQLKGPLANFLEGLSPVFASGELVVVNTETPQPAGGDDEDPGRVDASMTVAGALTGHVELKRPGLGADPNRLPGKQNKAQWERFKRLPNLIYTDGRAWGLYRTGAREGAIVALTGNPDEVGVRAVTEQDVRDLTNLLRLFFGWVPVVPRTGKALAQTLAPLCRLLRDEIRLVLDDPAAGLVRLSSDVRRYLFPGADTDEVADAFAQTFTYALLIARLEGARPPFTASSARLTLEHGHTLLAQILNLLDSGDAREPIDTSVGLLERVIGEIKPELIVAGKRETWLYFYEEFLGTYDQNLRKKVGAYYTPAEVVHAQVGIVDGLLRTRFGKVKGFADPEVVTLDPAAGTGTYPLAVLQRVVEGIPANRRGSTANALTGAAGNLWAFEYLVGPYSVANLRIARYLAEHGAASPADGPHVLLADTLASHEDPPLEIPFAYSQIGKERERATVVKRDSRVVVCLGNPPYLRGKANDETTGDAAGGWVAWRRPPARPGASRDHRDPVTRRMVRDPGERGILVDFMQPAVDAGNGGDLKNLYNAYAYFWRWALWKVFEQEGVASPNGGIVTFITASSYLRGPGFVGMRQHMRAVLDELWIIDLGGDNKGARRTENVFAIETPVCIAVGVRHRPPDLTTPAAVRYADLSELDARQKLDVLASIGDLDHPALQWAGCLAGWQDPFLPADNAAYFGWPLLTDVFPWQVGGTQVKRAWPIGETRQVLTARWDALVAAPPAARGPLLKESDDRKATKRYPALTPTADTTPIAGLAPGSPGPAIRPYSFRSMDQQWLVADGRVADRLRPSLWKVDGPDQVYLSSLLTGVLGRGPATVAAPFPPDLHHFRGSFGGTDTIPLWRDAAGTDPNVTAGVLPALAVALGVPVGPEDLFAYAHGVLGGAAYVDRFWKELSIPGPRLPVTTDHALFAEVTALGQELIRLETLGARGTTDTGPPVPEGTATYAHPITGGAAGHPERFTYDPQARTLTVGDGRYDDVAPEVWEHRVSGLQIVESWLGYRLRRRAGKNNDSPLSLIRPDGWPDPDGEQLLTLLWAVEGIVAAQPRHAALLERVLAGPTLAAEDLPMPTRRERSPYEDPDDDQDGDQDTML